MSFEPDVIGRGEKQQQTQDTTNHRPAIMANCLLQPTDYSCSTCGKVLSLDFNKAARVVSHKTAVGIF